MEIFNAPKKPLKHYLFLRRFSSDGTYGGCEKLFVDWSKKINYNKFKVTLGLSKGKKDIFKERLKLNNLPIEIIEFHFNSKNNFFKKFLNMLRFLEKINPTDVVYIEGGFEDFDLPYVLAGYIYTMGNVFMTEHSVCPMPLKKTSKCYLGLIPGLGLWWFKQRLFSLIRAQLPKRILSVSKEVRERLVRLHNYPNKKNFVGYHGVDLEIFLANENARKVMRENLDIPEGDIIIISTARLSREKCLYRLINAFDLISQKLNNCWLLIVGDGPLMVELKEITKQKSSCEKIKFLGHREEVSDYLKTSDIYVLPSDYEGFPIAMCEAMSTGLICIATKTAGPSEIIKDGVNGFLAEKDGHGVINGLIKALSLSEKERKQITYNARKYIEENFDIVKRVKEELNILGFNESG